MLADLTAQYQREYQLLSRVLIEGQGDDMELVDEYEALKERYFNALLLQLKLQYESQGSKVSADVAELYADFEPRDFRAWPSDLERILKASAARAEAEKEKPNV